MGTTFLSSPRNNPFSVEALRPLRQVSCLLKGAYILKFLLSDCFALQIVGPVNTSYNYFTEGELEDLCKSCGFVNYSSKVQRSFIMFSGQKPFWRNLNLYCFFRITCKMNLLEFHTFTYQIENSVPRVPHFLYRCVSLNVFRTRWTKMYAADSWKNHYQCKRNTTILALINKGDYPHFLYELLPSS